MYKKKQMVFRGLDNIVIVDSDEALLVAAKGKIQDVKKVAEEMKGRGGGSVGLHTSLQEAKK